MDPASLMSSVSLACTLGSLRRCACAGSGGGPARVDGMDTVHIDDASDHRLDDYRSLTDVALRRLREPEGGLYMAESAKVIARAVQAGHRPRSVLTQEKWLEDVEHALAGADVPVYVASAEISEQVTGFAIHR